MNIKRIKNNLKQIYPKGKIIVTDPKNPTEIISEVESTNDHPKWSVAVAVIDSTRLHYHKKTTEVYHVLNGELKIYLDGKLHILKQGDLVTILPKTRHWSEGKETLVYVYSTPGWTANDHILVFKDVEAPRSRTDK